MVPVHPVVGDRESSRVQALAQLISDVAGSLSLTTARICGVTIVDYEVHRLLRRFRCWVTLLDELHQKDIGHWGRECGCERRWVEHERSDSGEQAYGIRGDWKTAR